jgi:GTP-binding protein
LRFLKHVERTRVLVFLIDATSPNPATDMITLERELREYDPTLLERPRLVALSKADLNQTPDPATFHWDHRISSVTGEGLPELLRLLWSLLQATRT